MGLYRESEMNHFINYYCYIPTTRGERVSNTFELFPAHVDMPQTSSEDILRQVTQETLTVLLNPHPKTSLLNQGGKTSDTINKL